MQQQPEEEEVDLLKLRRKVMQEMQQFAWMIEQVRHGRDAVVREMLVECLKRAGPHQLKNFAIAMLLESRRQLHATESRLEQAELSCPDGKQWPDPPDLVDILDRLKEEGGDVQGL